MTTTLRLIFIISGITMVLLADDAGVFFFLSFLTFCITFFKLASIENKNIKKELDDKDEK